MTQSLQNIIDLIKPYYDENSSGGNLHIVLDDGNLESEDIAFCAIECVKNKDRIGFEICYQLNNLSYEEREILYSRYGEYRKG